MSLNLEVEVESKSPIGTIVSQHLGDTSPQKRSIPVVPDQPSDPGSLLQQLQVQSLLGMLSRCFCSFGLDNIGHPQLPESTALNRFPTSPLAQFDRTLGAVLQGGDSQRLVSRLLRSQGLLWQ